jgi:hypothetical protein
MSLDAIVKTLTQFGFVFHSFTEIEYGEPKVFSNAEKLASTQMVSGKAIFVPDEQKLRDLDQAKAWAAARRAG